MTKKPQALKEMSISGDYPQALPPMPDGFKEQPGVAEWYRAMQSWWFDLKTVLLRDRELLSDSVNGNTNESTAISTSLTAQVAVLQAQITTLQNAVTALQAEVAAGSSVVVTGLGSPTGTGFVHVSAGAQDAASKLVENADVATAAGIVESKLALNYPTHSNANDPTAGEKAALAGTSGAPGGSNKYVTNSDSRLMTAELSFVLQFMDL